MTRIRLLFAGLASAMLLWLPASDARAGSASDWVSGFNSKTRLTIGGVDREGKRVPYAFIEVVMPKGWKTYWRNPGDAGGLPPRFDWSGSENLKSARTLFPAPTRLTDEAGETIGYKDAVTFPVEIEATDPSKPVRLNLELSFGICKDICVPSEARHVVDVEPAAVPEATEELRAVLEQVPRSEAARQSADPVLKEAVLKGGSGSKLVLEVAFPGGQEKADVFIEAPDGLYVPMAAKAGAPRGDRQVFESELGNTVSPKDLSGKLLSATIVSAKGNSIVTFTVP